MAKFIVSDTVTYTRKWVVEAPDEDTAIDIIWDAGGRPDPFYEEMTGVTPYQAEPA